MSNMSDCRFTNTRSDLNDCLLALREDKRLSDFEAEAGRNMFIDFLCFCLDYDIIEEYDSENLQALFDGSKEREHEDE